MCKQSQSYGVGGVSGRWLVKHPYSTHCGALRRALECNRLVRQLPRSWRSPDYNRPEDIPRLVKAETTTTTIYDAGRSLQFNPVGGLYVFVMGLLLSIWYLRGIGDAIKADIHYFPAAYHSSPFLTVTFAVLKLVAYPSFALLFAIMIYAPVRNLLLPRVVDGPLEKVSARSARNEVLLFLQVGGQAVTLHQAGELKAELDRCTVLGDELRFTIGAFGCAAKVERLVVETS